MRACNLKEKLNSIEADKTIIYFLQQKIEIGSFSIRKKCIYIDWRPLETPESKFRTTIINFKGVE